MLSPSVLSGAVRAFRRGHRQVGVQADPKQLGAAAIVDRDGLVVRRRAARDAADHPPLDWILGGVREVLASGNPVSRSET